MTVIDTHAHIIVPQITRDAAPDESWRPRVYWENGQQITEFGGKQIKSPILEFVNIDKILAEQDKAGVDRVLLAPWASLLRYDASPEEGLDACHVYNEALAGLVQTHPDRVSALGMIPLQDPELAAREVEALMGGSVLSGVLVSGCVNGTYLGDPRFTPFWDAAEASGALVFIHPAVQGINATAFQEYYMWNTVGNPLDTTISAAHLIMSGTMEAHPRLKVLLAHGGGGILSLRGRLGHSHSFHPLATTRLKESVDESMKRFYYDSAVHNVEVLQTLIDFVGVDHVMVGSDYPFDMGSRRPADIVRALGLPAEDEERILYRNVAGLIGLEV